MHHPSLLPCPKPVLFLLHYESISQKEIVVLSIAKGTGVREQVRHFAHNSIHCVLVYAWKTRSISWVSRFLKSLALDLYKRLPLFNKIFGNLFAALVLNHLSTWQSGAIPPSPSRGEFIFSWRAITGQMPGYRRCFSSSSICLLGRLLRQFYWQR